MFLTTAGESYIIQYNSVTVTAQHAVHHNTLCCNSRLRQWTNVTGSCLGLNVTNYVNDM